jgi:imidazolonepropionase-like amidohydrolase
MAMTFKIRHLFWVLVLAALITTAACTSEPCNTTAFVGVNLVPMDREVVLEEQTVIVSGDRIAEVGPASEIRVPRCAEKIDGKGMYLMPGLADMHVHIWNEDHMQLYLANGVTTIKNMWGAPLHIEWQKEIESGERVGPAIYTTGPLMDGPGAFWPGSTILESPEQVPDEIRRQKEAGYGAVKVYNNLSNEVYQAIVREAKALGMRVEGHVPDAVGLRAVLEAGQNSNEHLGGYMEASLAEGSPIDPAWSTLPLPEYLDRIANVATSIEAGEIALSDVYDAAKLEEMAVATREAGMWNAPTLSVFKNMPSDDVLKLLQAPEMRYLDPSTRQSWDPRHNIYSNKLTDEQLRANLVWQESRFDRVRALHRAGARLLLGTDTPNPLVIPGFSVHEELGHLVACGLTPYEAISAGTIDAAEYVGASDEWGSLVAGLRADLILLRANPLEDVANAARPAGVMVRGNWLPAEKLQKHLEALAAAYAEQEGFVTAVLEEDLETAMKLYEEYPGANDGGKLVDEDVLIDLGYGLLTQGKVETAIQIFKLAVREYPDSSNAWDSLAEGCMIDGQPEKAIEYYERSLELDPSNGNAIAKLQQLRGE